MKRISIAMRHHGHSSSSVSRRSCNVICGNARFCEIKKVRQRTHFRIHHQHQRSTHRLKHGIHNHNGAIHQDYFLNDDARSAEIIRAGKIDCGHREIPPNNGQKTRRAVGAMNRVIKIVGFGSVARADTSARGCDLLIARHFGSKDEERVKRRPVNHSA